MAKPNNWYETQVREAAARIDAARDAGQQLTLLPDEGRAGDQVDQERGVGRPKGAKGKVSSQMRDWLAGEGYRMPEDMLAQMAGLGGERDAVVAAMAATERVLGWAYDGHTTTGKVRLATFMQIYTIQLRAAEALLPYGAPKATPDVTVNQTTNVIVPAMPSRPADRGDQARDITPKAPRSSGRMMPADVAEEMKRKQAVSDDDPGQSDGGSRTE